MALRVQFTDTSTGSPTSWSWSFGDGTTSTSQNPSHDYTAAGTYTVALTASNSAGSNTVTKAGYITVTAAAATDTSWPTVPTNVVASNIASASFALAWSASTDAVGVTGYEVQVNGTSYATPTGTSVTVTGLTPATAYSVRVRARDAAGNWSALSTAITVTTAAATSSAPVNLFSSQTPTTPDLNDNQSITLATRFMSDADGNVTGVRFYRAATAPTSVIGLLYSDAGVELARATFGTLVVGWNTVNFASPVAITANTYYRAAYWTSGPYVLTSGLFSPAVVNGHLTGTGGYYAYGASPTAPTNLGGGSYFADVAVVVTGVVAAPGFASAPLSPQMMPSNASLYVSWTAPATDGGSAITGYDVQPFAGTTGGAITSVGATKGATVTGLTNGTAYTVKVRAKNTSGAGAWSTASAAKTPAAPPAGSVTHGYQITAANTGHDNYVDPALGRKVTDADLTVHTGDVALSDLTTAGGTITRHWFKGGVINNLDNVTFVACRFDHGFSGYNNGVSHPFTWNWCTLDAPTPNAQGVGGVTYNNFTLFRCRIGGEMDGLKANGNVLARECFIRTTASAPDDHNDGVQSTGSDMGNIIERCNIDCRPVSGIGGPNAALFVADNSSGLHAWVDNYLMGGDFPIRMYDAATYNVQGNWILNGTFGGGPVDRRVIPASDVTWGTVRPNLVVDSSGAQVSVVAAP